MGNFLASQMFEVLLAISIVCSVILAATLFNDDEATEDWGE